MKKLLFVLLFIPSICFAQYSAVTDTAQLNDVTNKQADIVVQNGLINQKTTQIANLQSQIATAQNQITSDNSAIAADNVIINAYNIANAQTISAWNFDYDAQLEAGGCRWATCFPVVFPNANLSAIATAINIQCPVQESAVNWNNWPTCEAKNGSTAANWETFYCNQGAC